MGAAFLRLLVLTAIAVPAGAASGAPLPDAVERLGPGTTLRTLRERDGAGWTKAYVVRVDLADARVRPDVLFPGVLTAVRPLSAMARRAGAIAAVNGDFFNITATKAPVGPVVTGGRLIKGPQRHRTRVAGVGHDGVGRIAAVRLRGSVRLPSGSWPLSCLNDANPGFAPLVAPDGIGLFTPVWGSYSRAGAVRGASRVTEVTVRRGRVAGVRGAAGDGAIPAGGYVLLGAGAGARALARLEPGDPVSVRYRQQTAAPAAFRFAVGGKHVLLRRGDLQRGLPRALPAPRTAIGFSAGGRQMYLVVTEGRRPAGPGLSLRRLAGLMRRLGVRDAVVLDQGGSSTIVARPRGQRRLRVLNHLADGRERPVANGIGVFPTR